MKDMIDYESLKPFARNSGDAQCLKLFTDGYSRSEIADLMGISKDAIRKRLSRIKDAAALRGWSPEHNMTKTTPETHIVKGTSTLYDSMGDQKLQWVKTNVGMEQQLEALKEAVEALREDIPSVPVPTPHPNLERSSDVIPWFNMGDAHIGALAHRMETGFDNDIRIAERELMGAMFTLIDETPACDRCVINDLGDASHYETHDGVTMAHGNQLDYDTRYSKMIASYVRIMKGLINHALKKFNFVDIIINQGNHSRSNDVFMRELLLDAYGHSDRVWVLDNANVFIPYRMGNTFVMTHHGDKAKHNVLSGVMATDYSKHWGESTYRYIYTGHIHHREMISKEQAGVVIESWNSMSRGDKYAHDGGWRSRKCLSVVDLSKTYGEVGRRTIPIERVQDIVEGVTPGTNATLSKSKDVHSV